MSLWQDHKLDVVGLGIKGREFEVSLGNGRPWGKRKRKGRKEGRKERKEKKENRKRWVGLEPLGFWTPQL